MTTKDELIELQKDAEAELLRSIIGQAKSGVPAAAKLAATADALAAIRADSPKSSGRSGGVVY